MEQSQVAPLMLFIWTAPRQQTMLCMLLIFKFVFHVIEMTRLPVTYLSNTSCLVTKIGNIWHIALYISFCL